jgi:lysozyme
MSIPETTISPGTLMGALFIRGGNMPDTRTELPDVSDWDGEEINFARMKQTGCIAIIAKASQLTPSSHFARYWREARAAGMLRGAYHYLDWRGSEVAQAELFVSVLQNDPGELPPFLDLEMYPEKYGLKAMDVQAKVRRFLTIVETRLGKTPGIYVGWYYWNDWGSNDAWFARFPFWLPWYAAETVIKVPRPWKTWDFWQYTDKGNPVPYGVVATNLDMNKYCGPAAQMLVKYGPAPTPAPVVPVPANLYRVVKDANPNVRSSPGGAIVGMLLHGTEITVNDMATQPNYAHFTPMPGYPNGGWVWKAYIEKV